MKNAIVLLISCALLSGCATPGNVWKQFLGVSTEGIEECRVDADVKIFDYDYKTCYQKVEDLLKRMPHISIYAKNKEMIAVYYINPNTTPVGIFFTQIDANRTQVEISSESTPTKQWVAKNVFSETLQVEPKDANISN